MLTIHQIEAIERLFAGWSPSEPGGVLALLSEGELVSQRCFGLASLEHAVPISATTRFHICSISKTFVGAACALLHHQGRLDLDGDVREHVPELPLSAPMSIRHLLNMTSGLRDSMEAMMVRGVWYRYPRSTRDLLELVFAQTTLSYATGTRFAYTNINFTLLSLVIERVTGLSFDDFLAQAFWGPLGMRDTLLRESNTVMTPALADPYLPAAGGWEKGTWAFGLGGAGGLVSTAGDLGRWHGMFRSGGLHDAPLIELMSERGLLTSGVRTHYGLGLSVRAYRGITVQGHGGGLPGYRTMFARVPELDLAVVLLANRDDIDTYGRLRDIVDVCLGDDHAPPRPVRLPVADAALGGVYLSRQTGEPMTVAYDPQAACVKLNKLDVNLTLHGDGDASFIDDWANFRSTLKVEADAAGQAVLHLDFGGQVSRFDRVDAYIPLSDDLAAAVGLFRCADMRSEAEIWIRNDKLVVRFGPAFHREAELELDALARDVFAGVCDRPWNRQTFAVRFQRRSGRISRMLVSSNLLKDTEFVRV